MNDASGIFFVPWPWTNLYSSLSIPSHKCMIWSGVGPSSTEECVFSRVHRGTPCVVCYGWIYRYPCRKRQNCISKFNFAKTRGRTTAQLVSSRFLNRLICRICETRAWRSCSWLIVCGNECNRFWIFPLCSCAVIYSVFNGLKSVNLFTFIRGHRDCDLCVWFVW